MSLAYPVRFRRLGRKVAWDFAAQIRLAIAAAPTRMDESVVTALACFALYPDDFRQSIGTALWQGGDTDTIAAMTGALVGAHAGSGFADALPIHRLEDGQPFIAYLRELAERLTAECTGTSRSAF